MFDALWTHLNVATFDEGRGYGIIEDAAIGVKNGRIAFIGPAFDLPDAAYNANALFDGKGRWALPGFIDCHTHLIYAGNRAAEFEKRLQGHSYQQIAIEGGGILSTVADTRAASEQELYDLAFQRIKQLFRQGVTGFDVKSGYGLDLENEQKMLRVATRLRDDLGIAIQRTFLGAHAVPPEFKGRTDDYVDHLTRNVLPALASLQLVDTVDAFCDAIGFSAEQVRKIFDMAQELSLPVKLHADQLTNQHGAALASEYQALSADHLEYLDEAGVKAMVKSKTVAVLLPSAFYYLRETKKPPINLLREYSVPMALASDHNPGTSPVLSLLAILNMGCILFDLSPEEALRGVTLNAAKALGWQDDHGSLSVGKIADIAIYNITHPRDLVYGIGENPCTGVYMGGNYFSFEDEA